MVAAMPEHDPPRQITDSLVLAAYSHPLRRRLLDALSVDDAATASMLAEATGQAVGNVSHHLKVLASARLIEEAPELARDRRERWWRRTSRGLRWSSQDFRGDPASEAVAEAALSLNLDRQFEIVRRWYAASDEERAAWPNGPFSTGSWLKLTDGELAQLCEELVALLDRYDALGDADDGVERETVFVFANGAPGRP
jgi:DNA-binding transcriptional ArsR family regulator